MSAVQISEVAAAEAIAHLADTSVDAVLVDVRELDEWEAGHAPGALHVPLSAFDPGAIPEGATVLCICRSGARSARVVAALVEIGLPAVNVGGGMQAWHAAGHEVVSADGGPGVVI